MNRPVTEPLTPEIAAQLRQLWREHGPALPRLLGLDGTSLARAAAELPLRQGTRTMLERALLQYDARAS
jgi:hypothetical protein